MQRERNTQRPRHALVSRRIKQWKDDAIDSDLDQPVEQPLC